MILKLANGDLADPALPSEAVSFLETTLGGTFPADLENLPAALARHLVLCELQQTLTTLPTMIARPWARPQPTNDAAQFKS